MCGLVNPPFRLDGLSRSDVLVPHKSASVKLTAIPSHLRSTSPLHLMSLSLPPCGSGHRHATDASILSTRIFSRLRLSLRFLSRFPSTWSSLLTLVFRKQFVILLHALDVSDHSFALSSSFLLFRLYLPYSNVKSRFLFGLEQAADGITAAGPDVDTYGDVASLNDSVASSTCSAPANLVVRGNPHPPKSL